MLVKADFCAYEQKHHSFRQEVLGGCGLETFAPIVWTAPPSVPVAVRMCRRSYASPPETEDINF